MKNSIALVGFRCTGKSAVGEALAQRLDFAFHDTDKQIEERAGKPISRIFDEDGESAFRALEAEVIAEVSAQDAVVVAAGGGAVMVPRNVENIRRNCFVALLKADVETILCRMENDPSSESMRPPLTDMEKRKEIEHLLSTREKAYLDASDIEIDTSSQDVDAVAGRIAIEFAGTSEP